jgi:hypothetical protein
MLSVGPNTSTAQVVALAKQLATRVEAGAAPELGGAKIDAHQVSKACTCLQDEKTRAPELLLVHPEITHKRKQLDESLKKLRQAATLPVQPDPLPLVHPLGVFWFIPPPGPEAAAWPELAEVRLVGAGDDADLELDIIFDR